MAAKQRLLDKLVGKFTIGDDCWEWTAGIDGAGYGQLAVQNGEGKTSAKAHRLVYELLRGPIPEGLELDHLCRNRRCVKPGHLEPVTHAENVSRGRAGAHHAAKTHCPQGHPYDEANTYVRKDRVNRRQCRACANQASQRSRTAAQTRRRDHRLDQ